eukprot:359416-Chlamydomonas_euryale.AAC.23
MLAEGGAVCRSGRGPPWARKQASHSCVAPSGWAALRKVHRRRTFAGAQCSRAGQAALLRDGDRGCPTCGRRHVAGDM